ncbi:hypothetical protein LMG28614_07040 [Paraburkholderia ultramafica]|uniref:Uncharacterized protein n=1 Tax=Paraburkholderia ultramafica TaxID=1544867 RepID=A0A6S7D7G3_9BURK|nr:hypothetical protein LMG28614_07040 [Paraburkholderia ultramafica]
MEPEAAVTNLSVPVLLTLSGGFLDAFTYIGHGKAVLQAQRHRVIRHAKGLHDRTVILPPRPVQGLKPRIAPT